jgi:hypothetical protein
LAVERFFETVLFLVAFAFGLALLFLAVERFFETVLFLVAFAFGLALLFLAVERFFAAALFLGALAFAFEAGLFFFALAPVFPLADDFAILNFS